MNAQVNPYAALIAALRSDGVAEHADVAEVLEHVGAAHVQAGQGCGCAGAWPCPQRSDADGLALLYAIRGSNQAWARVQGRLEAAKARERAAA